ncbi:hypothetical protein P7K49_009976 [Saguinus oedipus]|uniref:Uncharacterized protein n=1 Tax=Saguinus oedipus TaxID=9490 RepID=A0ABQ9VM19_SAGOE|nr:hypothetical protein P7K49_009976 [Saguinus oedipus]
MAESPDPPKRHRRESTATTPSPGAAPSPPQSPALPGNRSPGRRETLSPGPFVGRTEPPGPMAQKPLSTSAAERMNLVAQDEIWRYRLKAESEARQNWPQNWGFLTTPFEELIKSEEELPTPKPKIELPERFHIRPVTPVEKYIKV